MVNTYDQLPRVYIIKLTELPPPRTFAAPIGQHLLSSCSSLSLNRWRIVGEAGFWWTGNAPGRVIVGLFVLSAPASRTRMLSPVTDRREAMTQAADPPEFM
jgi:hypothetical protein